MIVKLFDKQLSTSIDMLSIKKIGFSSSSVPRVAVVL
jgi:hypothetical protein